MDCWQHIHQTKDPTVCLGDDKDAGSSSSDDDESSEENLRISFAVEVSARLRVERPKSGLPLDLGLKIIMDGRVRYHNLIEYNFIHIRIYLSRAIFFHFVFRFRFRLPIFRTDTLGLRCTI